MSHDGPWRTMDKQTCPSIALSRIDQKQANWFSCQHLCREHETDATEPHKLEIQFQQ